MLLFQGLEVLEKKRSASLLPSHAQKAASLTLLYVLSKVYSNKKPLRTFLSTSCLECWAVMLKQILPAFTTSNCLKIEIW